MKQLTMGSWAKLGWSELITLFETLVATAATRLFKGVKPIESQWLSISLIDAQANAAWWLGFQKTIVYVGHLLSLVEQ